jgi:hypothetical protein
MKTNLNWNKFSSKKCLQNKHKKRKAKKKCKKSLKKLQKKKKQL